MATFTCLNRFSGADENVLLPGFLQQQRVVEVLFEKLDATLEETRSNMRARICLEQGPSIVVSLVAECCSESFFTDLAQFRELVGSKIRGIEKRSQGTPSAHSRAEPPEQEDVQWGFLVFVTDKGHVTIDWRNESNGQYTGTAMVTLDSHTPPVADLGPENQH